MGSVGGVALHFVAQPVTGKAPLELLGCKGDSACALVIADKDFGKKYSHHNPWLAGASCWDGFISSASGNRRACDLCPWLGRSDCSHTRS